MQQYADYKILILAEEEMLKERLVSRKEKVVLQEKKPKHGIKIVTVKCDKSFKNSAETFESAVTSGTG